MGDVSSIHRRRIFHPETFHHEVVSLSSLSRDTEMESPRVCQPRSRSRSHTPQHLGLSNKMLNKMLTKTIVQDDFKGFSLKLWWWSVWSFDKSVCFPWDLKYVLVVSNLIFASLEFLERSSMPILQFFLQNAQATWGGGCFVRWNWGKKEKNTHRKKWSRGIHEQKSNQWISGISSNMGHFLLFFFGGSAPGCGGCRTLCGSPRGGTAL